MPGAYAGTLINRHDCGSQATTAGLSAAATMRVEWLQGPAPALTPCYWDRDNPLSNTTMGEKVKNVMLRETLYENIGKEWKTHDEIENIV